MSEKNPPGPGRSRSVVGETPAVPIPKLERSMSCSKRSDWRSNSKQRTTIVNINTQRTGSSRQLLDQSLSRHNSILETPSNHGVRSEEKKIMGEAETILDAKVYLLQQIGYIAQLTERQQEKLALSSQLRKFNPGEPILVQGDEARCLYVVAEGEVLVTTTQEDGDSFVVSPKRVEHSPFVFGEESLIGGESSLESVYAHGACLLLVLEGGEFDTVLATEEAIRNVFELRRRTREAQILDSVPILQNLSVDQRSSILHSMHPISFRNGEYICRQGHRGSTFYIVLEGCAKIVINHGITSEEIGTVYIHDFFGEQAFIHDKPRGADVIAVGNVLCLYMHRRSLDKHPGLRNSLELLAEFSVSGYEKNRERRRSSVRSIAEEKPENENKLFMFNPLASPGRINERTRRDRAASMEYAIKMDWEKHCELLEPPEGSDNLKVVLNIESLYEKLMRTHFLRFLVKNQEEEKTVCLFPKTLLQLQDPPSMPPNLLCLKAAGMAKAAAQRTGRRKSLRGGRNLRRRGNLAFDSSVSLPYVTCARLAQTLRKLFKKKVQDRTLQEKLLLSELFSGINALDRLSFGSDGIKQRIIDQFEYKLFQVGQTMLSQNDKVDGIYIILRGEVKLTIKETGAGSRSTVRTLGTIGPGATCGELSMLDPHQTLYSDSLYSASTTLRTEVVFLSAKQYHLHCVPFNFLNTRKQDVLLLDHLSCTKTTPPNEIAILHFAHALSYHTFPKDFCFSPNGSFFDPDYFHFILSGEVAVYNSKEIEEEKEDDVPPDESGMDPIKRYEWYQVARLGVGEPLTRHDIHNDSTALAAESMVQTLRLRYSQLVSIDPPAVSSILECMNTKFQWRQSIYDKLQDFDRDIPKPTWVFRAGKTAKFGPAARRVVENDDEVARGIVAPRKQQTSTKRVRQRRGSVTETDVPLDAAKKGCIKDALSVMNAHYSVNISDRHKAFEYPKTNPDVGHTLVQISAKKMFTESWQGKDLKSRMRKSPFATPTKNWCLNK